MSRFERYCLHLSTLLVGGTGLAYAWMLYLVPPSDPYAVVNHPWQPGTQHLHILVAPLLVFAVGLVWQRHIASHWKRGVKKRRSSGIFMVLTMVPMVASGYLIQTATGDGWRRAWVVVHLAASALWLAFYLGHQVVPMLAARRRRSRLATRRAGLEPASEPSPTAAEARSAPPEPA